MTDPLDTLRPEVRRADSFLDSMACSADEEAAVKTIRAELLRLTDENARLLAANRDAMDHFEQMKAEITIAHHERDRMFLDAREWATRFGEMEARAEKSEAELAALKARIAEACRADGQRVFDLLGLPIEFDGTLALVKVEG